jgi:predicted RNase H-like HicB family nuclease
MYTYKIQLQKEPEGGYTVTVPALPGCITYGENIDQAVAMAKEAIALYIQSLLDEGDPIPTQENYLEQLVAVSV